MKEKEKLQLDESTKWFLRVEEKCLFYHMRREEEMNPVDNSFDHLLVLCVREGNLLHPLINTNTQMFSRVSQFLLGFYEQLIVENV